MSDQQEQDSVPPLVAALIQSNYNDYANVSQGLIEGLSRDLRRAEACLALIRGEMAYLLGGQYMPTPNALMAALYPSESDVDKVTGNAGGGQP